MPSKTTIGRKASHYVRVAGVTGLDSLSIRLGSSDYHAGDSHDISVYENDDLKSLDIDYIFPSYGTKFDLSVRHNDKLKRFSFTSEESGCINILVSNECEVVVNGTSAKVFRYDRYIEGGKHEE